MVVGWGGGVCTVIFVSNPTTVLRLGCVVVGVVTKIYVFCQIASDFVQIKISWGELKFFDFRDRVKRSPY